MHQHKTDDQDRNLTVHPGNQHAEFAADFHESGIHAGKEKHQTDEQIGHPRKIRRKARLESFSSAEEDMVEHENGSRSGETANRISPVIASQLVQEWRKPIQRVQLFMAGHRTRERFIGTDGEIHKINAARMAPAEAIPTRPKLSSSADCVCRFQDRRRPPVPT